jgi:hypothetical protein
MFNPEFFLGAYKTPEGGDAWRPAALFTDEPPADVDAATSTVIMERRPLLLTAVPSEQQWATAAWAGKPVEPQTPRKSSAVLTCTRFIEPRGFSGGGRGQGIGAQGTEGYQQRLPSS